MLDRATLGNWVGCACFHLKPVVDHIRERLKGSDRIFMDENRAPVLDPGRRKTKTGYFWAIVSDDRGHGGAGPPVVMFHYAPGRGAVQSPCGSDYTAGQAALVPISAIRSRRSIVQMGSLRT